LVLHSSGPCAFIAYVGVSDLAIVAATREHSVKRFMMLIEPLFTCIFNNKTHVLQSYLPGITRPQCNLRTISYNKKLITKTSKLKKETLSYECCTKTAIDNPIIYL